jgi:general stress protein 26
MNQFKKSVFILCAILLSFNSNSFSQNLSRKDSTNIKLVKVAKTIMSEAETCALITLNENNLPMVRVMDPFLPENDLTVWFGTNPKSRKVDQIENNPNVTLYYLEKNSSGYVVIHGKAELIDDEREKEKRWKIEWEAFYPDKSEGYLLIKVVPISMEVISYTHDILGDPETWKTPVVYFDN